MKASNILIAAALAAAAVGAQADEADGSQFALPFKGTATRAEVQRQLAQPGVNTYSIQYNPVATFKSGRSRAEVRAEYVANRDAVAAMVAEDSGSTYLAQHSTVLPQATQLAGQPRNPQ